MDQLEDIEAFIIRTGASKELASKYLQECNGVLHTALVIFKADMNEGKIKL